MPPVAGRMLCTQGGQVRIRAEGTAQTQDLQGSPSGQEVGSTLGGCKGQAAGPFLGGSPRGVCSSTFL